MTLTVHLASSALALSFAWTGVPRDAVSASAGSPARAIQVVAGQVVAGQVVAGQVTPPSGEEAATGAPAKPAADERSRDPAREPRTPGPGGIVGGM